jgi:hypothetical protein
MTLVLLLTEPCELTHGERESFIGGYRWQRSGRAFGSPGQGDGVYRALSQEADERLTLF